MLLRIVGQTYFSLIKIWSSKQIRIFLSSNFASPSEFSVFLSEKTKLHIAFSMSSNKLRTRNFRARFEAPEEYSSNGNQFPVIFEHPVRISPWSVSVSLWQKATCPPANLSLSYPRPCHRPFLFIPTPCLFFDWSNFTLRFLVRVDYTSTIYTYVVEKKNLVFIYFY